MRVAVLTLTRDRLAYTRHCFKTLRRLAGCDFDHYVLDNGSQDGTPEWLAKQNLAGLLTEPDNIGVSRGLNKLLALTDHDVVIKFDNDCELATKNALRDCAKLVNDHPLWLLSPRIEGLNSPMPIHAEIQLDGHRVGLPPIIGGIFLAANIDVFRSGYRHNEGNPIWGMDDVSICHHVTGRGGRVGYLLDHEAWHYETTEGQRARFPDYFVRKDAEFAA